MSMLDHWERQAEMRVSARMLEASIRSSRELHDPRGVIRMAMEKSGEYEVLVVRKQVVDSFLDAMHVQSRELHGMEAK